MEASNVALGQTLEHEEMPAVAIALICAWVLLESTQAPAARFDLSPSASS